MRSLLACLLIVGCDAGPPTTKPAPPTPKPDVAPAAKPQPPPPPPLRVIDLQLGGLGVWKGNVVGGILYHVRVDLGAAHLAMTDPGGKTTEHELDAATVREYRQLAKVAHDEIHTPPKYSCTDRSEVLTIDTVAISDSCPLSDAGASALSARLQREFEQVDR
jgi:hypothetical protein